MRKITLLFAFAFVCISYSWGQLFITELADPNNAYKARYVEIYNAGVSAVDLSTGWDLQRWTNGYSTPQTAKELTGTIAAGGFYIVCSDQITFTSTYGFAADQNLGGGGPADSNGDDQIALRDPTDAIVDMFGVPGEDGSGTNHEFEDGRAERKATITNGNATYTFAEWNIWNDTGGAGTTNQPQNAPADFDPGVWIGASVTPLISASPSVLNGFTYVFSSGGPSLDISMDVSGSNLTADIVLTTPTDFEMSLTSGSGYTSPITLTQSGGSVAPTTIYVRMISGLAAGDYSEDIVITSTGASNKNVTCNGTVEAPATTTLPYTESFDVDLGACYTYSVAGVNTWYYYSGGQLANSNGFGGGNPEEDWLVIPGIDLDAYSNEVMTFNTSAKYGTNDANNYLKLMYSTDYAGIGDPTAATWTELSYTQPAGINNSTEVTAFSGNVDLSGITGTSVYIAFKYLSTNSPTRWGVDDIYIGEAGPAASTWIGAAKSTNWAASGNWNNGVPGVNTNVTIPAGLSTYPTLSAAGVCNDIFLGSTASSTASLMDNGFLTVYGNVTMQQYLDAQTAGGNDNWHFVSSPVSGTTADVFHLSGSTGLNVYLQSFDETTNTYSDMVSGALNAAEGYAVWVDGANAAPPVTNYTFEYVGGLNTGSFTANLTRTIGGNNGGNNLVGNPYVSSLDWNAAGWTKTNVQAAIYVEDQGSWGIYDAVNGSTGSGNQGQYIAPGSGFFVFVMDNGSTTGTLTMDNTVRVHSTAQVLKSTYSNYLRLEATGNGRNDIAVVHFMENADALFNGQEDARKLFAVDASYPQIYTVADKMLAANALPETEMVSMGFVAGVDGEYTISAIEINDIPSVWLEDTFTGIFTNLTSDSYTFNYSTTDNPNRFILHFAPLAVAENAADLFSIFAYNNEVIVSTTQLVSNADVSVYNVMGQLVATAQMNGNVIKVKLDNSSVYIVKVVSQQGVVSKKVFLK